MFGPIGGPELILILVLALLLFGPRKMPDIGRMVGKALAEFRSVTTEFKSTLDREVALDEIKKTRDDLQNTVREVKGAVSTGILDDTAGPATASTADTEPKAPAGAEMVAEATRENGGEPQKPPTPDGGTADKT